MKPAHMRTCSGSIVPHRAPRHVYVVAWAIVAVTALPYRVAGQCTPLTCDTTVNGSIETASEADCFFFTATDGELVDISVVGQEEGSSLRPSWLLVDRTGAPVDGPCGNAGPSNPNYQCGPLAASGSPYGIGVLAGQSGFTGAYAVRFQRVTAEQACEDVPLPCGVPVFGEIDDPLDTDLFSFSVDDGEWISIQVFSGFHGGTVIDAAWHLIDGSGTEVTGPCGEFSQLGAYACGPLPASGNPYRIMVGDEEATYAGQYKVRFERLAFDKVCSSTALPCGVALITEIEDPSPNPMCGFVECPILDTQLFNFSVADGERIAVTVDTVPPTGDHFVAGWRVLDRTGMPIEGVCGDFESGNIECGPLPASGNPYQIEVGDVSQYTRGHAHVSVNTITTTCATECRGDCDGGQTVSVDELLTLVNIALGSATTPDCIAGDGNRDGSVEMDELIGAVNNALNGCGAPT